MSEGKNCDEGKLRVDLVAPEIVEAIARVCGEGRGRDEDGNLKYEDRNWEKGMNWMRQYGSALRHLLKWAKGLNVDPESGCTHLEHALWRIGALVTYAARGIGIDDRSGQVGVSSVSTESMKCKALYSHGPAMPLIHCGEFSPQLGGFWWCPGHVKSIFNQRKFRSFKPFDYGGGQS